MNPFQTRQLLIKLGKIRPNWVKLAETLHDQSETLFHQGQPVKPHPMKKTLSNPLKRALNKVEPRVRTFSNPFLTHFFFTCGMSSIDDIRRALPHRWPASCNARRTRFSSSSFLSLFFSFLFPFSPPTPVSRTLRVRPFSLFFFGGGGVPRRLRSRRARKRKRKNTSVRTPRSNSVEPSKKPNDAHKTRCYNRVVPSFTGFLGDRETWRADTTTIWRLSPNRWTPSTTGEWLVEFNAN